MVDYTQPLYIMLAFIITYLTVYQKNRLVGGVIFLTLSIMTITSSTITQWIGVTLTITSIINIIYDVFGVKEG